MKIYCMSDIHGCLAAFEEAFGICSKSNLKRRMRDCCFREMLSIGGEDRSGVLDKIMAMQQKYGYDKVIALMGNHEELVLYGSTV